jgi:phosphate transport system permease protein
MFGQSILSGALTLSIMILPVIIRTTEESLKAVSDSFREGSLALGTTRCDYLHVVLPQRFRYCNRSILAIGRVVGELLRSSYVGIARNLPTSIYPSDEPYNTSVLPYQRSNTRKDFNIAFATATVLVLVVLIVNR